jgi:hypothetical protein
MSERDEKRSQHFEWKPNVEFFTSLSADGRFVICKTVITAIKPITYFKKVLEGPARAPSQKAPADDSKTSGAGS